MQLGYKNAFVLAGSTKFRFKFIRRYGANLLNLYAQLNKFHSKFYAAEYVSTRVANQPPRTAAIPHQLSVYGI